jgi:Na+-transporting NADH:ubiquinone oxidoreductase subunit NqrC
VGKSIVGEMGEAGIVINGVSSEAQNQIDAISGATMTCDKVESMLNAVIEDIVQEDE